MQEVDISNKHSLGPIWSKPKKGENEYRDKMDIPDICHFFFTRAKFLENKIYTEIHTVNCQFTQ